MFDVKTMRKAVYAKMNPASLTNKVLIIVPVYSTVLMFKESKLVHIYIYMLHITKPVKHHNGSTLSPCSPISWIHALSFMPTAIWKGPRATKEGSTATSNFRGGS